MRGQVGRRDIDGALQPEAPCDAQLLRLVVDVETVAGLCALGEEVAMRVSLNQQPYFAFVVRIQNVRSVDEDESFRHGANFLTETVNAEALHHFVKFIETVSASLQNDNGDITVTNIAR